MIALIESRLQLAEHYSASYAAVLPAGVTLEEAVTPEYWAHVSLKLRQHDMIRLIPEDGSYFAQVLVLDAGRGFAKVRLLQHIPFDEPEAVASELVDLFVKWDGPHNKYAVIRKSDNEKLKTGFVQKPDAQCWLDDHLASLDR